MTALANPTPNSPRPDSRAALLLSAERLFAERPYESVRVEEIAADANVAKGLIGYHFENKRGLYAAVIEGLVEDMIVRTTPDRSLPPTERTKAVTDSFIQWATEVQVFKLAVAGAPGSDPVIRGLYRRAFGAMTEVALDGMRDYAEELGLEDPTKLPMMRGAVLGWLSFVWTVTDDWLERRDMTPTALRELFVRALGVTIASTLAAGAKRSEGDRPAG